MTVLAHPYIHFFDNSPLFKPMNDWLKHKYGNCHIYSLGGELYIQSLRGSFKLVFLDDRWRESPLLCVMMAIYTLLEFNSPDSICQNIYTKMIWHLELALKSQESGVNKGFNEFCDHIRDHENYYRRMLLPDIDPDAPCEIS